MPWGGPGPNKGLSAACHNCSHGHSRLGAGGLRPVREAPCGAELGDPESPALLSPGRVFTGGCRAALGDLDPNPPLTPEPRVQPHSEPLFLCEFWIPFWKVWSVSCLQQQKGVGEGKTLKICGCLVALWGAELGKSFPETLPLKAPELLSYRGLAALPGCPVW